MSWKSALGFPDVPLNDTAMGSAPRCPVVLDAALMECVTSSIYLFTTYCKQQNFEYDEVKALIDQAIDPVLGSNIYQPKKVHGWCSQVGEGALKNLQASGKPFKYVVTCIIMQKNGAGLHTASTCYWDTLTDGSCSVRWENKTMHAIVTVFALHI